MKIKKILKFTLVLLFFWFTVHLGVLLIVGLNDDSEKTDAILIFGNKVELNGKPSERLKGRLDRGYELFSEGKSSLIIVSGGIGKEGFDEADVMKEYLVNEGISPNLIIKDSNGINTYATAKNLKTIVENKEIKSVIIVSNYYHLMRAKLAIGKFGFDPVYTSYSRIFPELRDFYSIPREIVGYYFYLFKDYK